LTRLIQTSPTDDLVNIFRQQASIIARKKESTAEKLSEILKESTRLGQQLDMKQATVNGMGKVRLMISSSKQYRS
jgi:intraflagellar transport protein 81